MRKITIAIDGHSSCGKSTMAKRLAQDLGYIYVDTGAMYRAVTLWAMERGLIAADGTVCETPLREAMPEVEITFKYNAAARRPDTWLSGVRVEDRIRALDVSSHVSAVAALPFVREAMVAKQREMGREGGVVMDGRDIGTTVFPDADLKVFVTASAQVRAQRRYDELRERGMAADYAEILRNVEERDYIDSHRAVSPLRQAPDALLLDNSALTRDEQQRWLMERAEEAIASAAARTID